MANRKRTRRAPGEGGISRRKDGRWEATYVDAAGKRHHVYGKTRREAAEKLVERQNEAARGVVISPTRETLAQFLDRWLRDVKAGNVRSRTLMFYATKIRLYVRDTALGRTRLRDVTAPQIQALYTTLRERGLGAKSIQGVHVTLKMALKQALLWNLVARNEAEGALPPKPEKRFRGNPLDDEEARRLLAVASSTKNDLYPLVALALDSGMGPGELFALQWKNVNLDRQTVTVVANLNAVGGKTLEDTKNEFRRRTIEINEDTVAALRAWRQRQRELRMAYRDRWNEQGFVFTTSTGGALNQSAINKRFKTLLKAAEIADRRPYDLRHTMATLMLKAGVSPKVVQERLGHSTISMTLNTYSHILAGMQREAADKLRDILRGEKQA